MCGAEVGHSQALILAADGLSSYLTSSPQIAKPLARYMFILVNENSPRPGRQQPCSSELSKLSSTPLPVGLYWPPDHTPGQLTSHDTSLLGLDLPCWALRGSLTRAAGGNLSLEGFLSVQKPLLYKSKSTFACCLWPTVIGRSQLSVEPSAPCQPWPSWLQVPTRPWARTTQLRTLRFLTHRNFVK